MATEFNLFDLGLTEDDTYLITATAKAEGRETSESSNIAEWTLSSETWMFGGTVSSRPFPFPPGAMFTYQPWASESTSGDYVYVDQVMLAFCTTPTGGNEGEWILDSLSSNMFFGFPTVRFLKPPTGDVLTWLETNASKM